jgi:hypothetical protein
VDGPSLGTTEGVDAGDAMAVGELSGDTLGVVATGVGATPADAQPTSRPITPTPDTTRRRDMADLPSMADNKQPIASGDVAV